MIYYIIVLQKLCLHMICSDHAASTLDVSFVLTASLDCIGSSLDILCDTPVVLLKGFKLNIFRFRWFSAFPLSAADMQVAKICFHHWLSVHWYSGSNRGR
jgi:hypothetical protein